MDLIAALWLLEGLDPRISISGQMTQLGDSLRQVGPGYWLEASGTLFLLIGATGLLVFSSFQPDSSPRAHQIPSGMKVSQELIERQQSDARERAGARGTGREQLPR